MWMVMIYSSNWLLQSIYWTATINVHTFANLYLKFRPPPITESIWNYVVIICLLNYVLG